MELKRAALMAILAGAMGVGEVQAAEHAHQVARLKDCLVGVV